MADNKKRKVRIVSGLSLFSASCVFLFLPDIAMFDFLPDVIGYILAVIGLSQLADLSDDIANAKRRFLQLTAVGFAKIVFFVIIYTSTAFDERPTAILMASFCIAVAQCALLIPAFISFFEGMLYLGTREDAVSVFRGNGRKEYRKSYSDHVKLQTVVFTVVLGVCSFLPEMLALSVDSNMMSYSYNAYEFIGVYRGMAFILVTVVGAVWLSQIQKYIKTVKRDETFINALNEKYKNEILTNEAMFFKKKINIAFLMLGIGAVLSLDMYIGGSEGYSIIPDMLCGIFMFIGIMILNDKSSRCRIPSLVLSSVYAVFSTVTSIINHSFAYEYTAKEIVFENAVHNKWIALIVIAATEALLFTAMIVCICLSLAENVKRNTGVLTACVLNDPAAKMKALHKKLNRMLAISAVIALLSGIGGVFRIVMYTRADVFADMSWIVEASITAVFATVFCLSLYNIKEEIEEKYLLV